MINKILSKISVGMQGLPMDTHSHSVINNFFLCVFLQEMTTAVKSLLHKGSINTTITQRLQRQAEVNK